MLEVQCSAAHCVKNTAVHFSAVHFSAVYYSAVGYGTLQGSPVQYCAHAVHGTFLQRNVVHFFVSMLLSAHVKRIIVSRMQDFYLLNTYFSFLIAISLFNRSLCLVV